MAELPSGTVTMLFSDIEGSTVLLQRLGPAYADALDAQRRVLREAWQAWNGREMGTEGDSFFVVFPQAYDAVSAALAAQRGLRSTSWPAGERVRVRMGLHSGEPTPYEDGYVGMDVHRAARVAATAHGGQVVLTDTTTALVRSHLPDGAWLSDLGEHRMKDMPAPEHLFQISESGDGEVFPPLRSLGASSSLPQPRTSLVGRAEEVARLTSMLSDPATRLVTLTGPGGAGKTRLAIEVASGLAGPNPDGVFFVPLAAVTTVDAMWATIADRLSLTEDRTFEHVLDQLANRQLLLVLDNLEQLPGAAGVVGDLLARGPRVGILATSRSPLHVGGENEYAVSPLAVPGAGGFELVQRSQAVQLFCQRAGLVRNGFALTSENAEPVARICRRLDGLPLAIELTAARCKLFSPAALLARLDSVLDERSVEVDRPPRQRSLRDTVGWSHDLLDPGLQVFFRRLGAFPGTADLDAVEAVTGHGPACLEAVAALVDLSLVRIVEGPDREPRILLLQTIRDFAREVLAEAGERDEVLGRHATHYAALVQELAPQLRTPLATEAAGRISLEHDNIRAALAWSLGEGEPGPVDTERRAPGVRICVALWWFWASHGQVVSGGQWYARALEASGDEDSAVMARILLGLGIWAMWDDRGSEDAPPATLLAAAEMAERWSDHATLSEATLTLAQWHQNVPDEVAAEQQYEEAARQAELSGDDGLRASVLHHHARMLWERAGYDRARTMLEEALAISTSAGNARDIVARRADLADVAVATGDAAAAESALVTLVPDVMRLREPALVVDVVSSFAECAFELGDLSRFVTLATARNVFHVEIGWPEGPLLGWEAYVGEARESLGEIAWEAARAEGRGLTMSEALDWAVRTSGPTTI